MAREVIFWSDFGKFKNGRRVRCDRNNFETALVWTQRKPEARCFAGRGHFPGSAAPGTYLDLDSLDKLIYFNKQINVKRNLIT